MLIYKTKERKGYGKNNYSWNEYRLEKNKVIRYKCHRWKFYYGDDSVWKDDETIDTSWNLDDPFMPAWIKRRLEEIREEK
jgi:hypothetical protein